MGERGNLLPDGSRSVIKAVIRGAAESYHGAPSGSEMHGGELREVCK